MHLCVFCSSVYSVRNRTLPLYDTTQKQHAGEFFLSQSAQSSRRFLAYISSPKDSGPSPFPSPAGRGVICEVTPIGLLTWVVEKFFSHGGCLFLTRRMSFSHTEDVFFSHRTHRFNRTFQPTFRTHRPPPAYRFHRTFQLKKGVEC